MDVVSDENRYAEVKGFARAVRAGAAWVFEGGGWRRLDAWCVARNGIGRSTERQVCSEDHRGRSNERDACSHEQAGVFGGSAHVFDGTETSFA